MSSFLFFFLAQTACERHACLRAPCVAWPLLLPSFSLSSLFFSVFCFNLPDRATPNLPDRARPNLPHRARPNLPDRARFSAFYGQRSVTAAWATRSPWSITPEVSNCGAWGGLCVWVCVGKPNLVKRFGPRLLLWACVLSLCQGCHFGSGGFACATQGGVCNA